MRILTFGAVAAVVLSAMPMVTTAHAATLVDTGVPSGELSWLLSSSQWLGGEFNLGSAAVISGVESYATFGGNGGTLTAAIYASDGTSVTLGAPLFAVEFSGPDAATTGWFGPSGLSWALDAGTYWVMYQVRAAQTFQGSLGCCAPSPLVREIFGRDGSYAASPLRIGWRITGETNGGGGGGPGVVPEPAAWAMLIAGFGLTGATLRRRRAVPA